MKNIIEMREKKRIAMVAHDRRKPDLLEWVRFNQTLDRSL